MIQKRKRVTHRVKPIKNNMPNSDAEDYHFPKNDHPCKLKGQTWLNMMREKGYTRI